MAIDGALMCRRRIAHFWLMEMWENGSLMHIISDSITWFLWACNEMRWFSDNRPHKWNRHWFSLKSFSAHRRQLEAEESPRGAPRGGKCVTHLFISSYYISSEGVRREWSSQRRPEVLWGTFGLHLKPQQLVLSRGLQVYSSADLSQ